MPPILTERVSWKKPRPQNETRRSSDLTPDEQRNVKTALRFLAKRHGTMRKLAPPMGVTYAVLAASVQSRRRVSAGIALRAARVARVPLEDVLAGRWPIAGACPHCGQPMPL